MFKLLICLSIALSGVAIDTAKADTRSNENKRLVLEFYDMAFSKHQPAEAARIYLGKVYKQHNPRVPDGPEIFAQFFENFFKQNPTVSNDVKRVIAEDDLVAIHSHSRMGADDRGRAIIDIFRVEDGKIVEHWDVIQSVPETSANKNSMF